MIRNKAVVSVCAACWAFSLSAATSDDQNPPSAPPAAAAQKQAPAAGVPEAPKKPALGSWWEKSPLEYTPVAAQWLFHATGTLSYMNAAGNTSGSTLDVSAGAEVRKERFTSHSFVQMSRKDVTYGFSQGTVNYNERTLREQVDASLTWYLKVVAGVESYRNTLMFMDKRLNVYGGVGATMFRNQKQQVTFTGGLGHADFVFDRAQMLRINPRQVGVLDTSPSSGGAIALQTWRWNVSPRFSFNEDASYMKYFDTDLGYRWTINLSGNVPINKRFSFNTTYRIKEETNTIIKALRVLPQDRTFLMGIRVSI